jgi:trk system potassium uptake protein TrkA
MEMARFLERRPTHLRVTVIGLGRFGRSVARSLTELGHHVTAIDRDQEQVDRASEFVSLAVQGDGTDEDLLRSINVERSDVAVVAQGSAIEASMLAPVMLKRLGVPWVVAKAMNELHGEVLLRVGADRVIYPERDAGVRLSHLLTVPRVDDYLSLTGSSGIATFTAGANLAGRTLADVRTTSGTQVGFVAIKRDQQIVQAPSPNERIRLQDELVLIGTDAEIEAFVGGGPLPGRA